MRRHWWGVAAFIVWLALSLPVSALDTVPTTPNKVASPLLITGYSFSGPTLRYVQIYNNSSSLAVLDGWQMSTATKSSPVVTTSHIALNGMLEPGKHVFAAMNGIVDRPSFILPPQDSASSSLVGAVSLVAPVQSGYNDEMVTVPTINSLTAKETIGTLNNYYVRRDVSVTTGNYLSGMSFMLPTEKLENDQLYVPPVEPRLQIVEVYPDASDCPPTATEPTCNDYVKLFNASTQAIDLSGIRVRTGQQGQSASSSNTRVLSGSLPAGDYLSFPLTLSASGSWVWLEDTYGTVRYDASVVGYPTSAGYSQQAWSYDDSTGEWRWTPIPSPGNIPNMFPVVPKVNGCTGLRINEIAANVATEDQYIEIVNATTQPVDTTGCVVQTNRSASISHTLIATELAADAHIAIYVKDTPLTLTKTTTGTVYILSSDMETEVDAVAYADLPESTAYAFTGAAWQTTYLLTPNAGNIFLEYPSCAIGSVRNTESGLCNKLQVSAAALEDCPDGKYRSFETNRCRSIEAPSDGLAPCASDQYRSPETNRCRSLVSTASVLAPCAVNQERNPDTNRCRSIGTSSDLQPCAANQDRNPETNRCRNIGSGAIATDFPVEAVAQSSEATLGWWAFGGVGTLVAAYAGWEWRREVLSWIRKVLPFGTGRS